MDKRHIPIVRGSWPFGVVELADGTIYVKVISFPVQEDSGFSGESMWVILEDGTEFDSSYKRGEPFQIVLSNNRVIQGWILGLKGMKTGGTRKLWVPAELAYGERQIGNMIPPNSNLIFEIELLEVLTRDD